MKKYFRRIIRRNDLLSFRSIINWILFLFTFGLFVLAIQDIGFPNPDRVLKFQVHNRYFQICYSIIGALYIIRSIFFSKNLATRKVFLTQLVIGVFLILFFFPNFVVSYGDTFEYYLYQTAGIQMLSFLLFFLELSRMEINLLIKVLNPAQLFMTSFAFFIFVGAMLLMMPMSTTVPIKFTDALFT
ncbi:MAG: hypothetical protein JNL03_07000, partial [Prolixibacteraceae bacterium]|nr:hypothetical protein [Prolixibacteraceae bacterium]